MPHPKDTGRFRPDTRLSLLGRDPDKFDGVVNTPVYHASTVLFPSVAALKGGNRKEPGKTFYGRHGTPTTFALQDAVAAMEGAHASFVFSSGKAAVLAALLAFVKAGDHVMMVDSAYGPSRGLAAGLLKRFGVETTFYDPLADPAAIGAQMKPSTKVVYTEAPGSLTFEMQDLPAIADMAHAAGAVVITDNTWASPLYCDPFKLGVDVSVQAGTKYIVGHSDAMLGVVSATEAATPAIQQAFEDLGACAGPDDCYLALRGMRTLSVRLARHQETGLTLARWFAARPEVARVLHPALPDDPGHSIWKRDFTGASGLFGVVLNPISEDAVAAFLDDMELFGMGYSWGGYESLMIPTWPHTARETSTWDPASPCIRVHAGLEDPADLIADLEAGFIRLKETG